MKLFKACKGNLVVMVDVKASSYITADCIGCIRIVLSFCNVYIHIKGFSFARQEKAYGCLKADDASKIYGDNFRIESGVIKEIGNNVTVSFENMDFGALGASKVIISGYTPLETNVITILFTDKNGVTTRRSVEFKGAEKARPAEQSFYIERIKGEGKVELVFLPGSNFDLESIQFAR